jgi:uncharacterized membrane protein
MTEGDYDLKPVEEGTASAGPGRGGGPRNGEAARAAAEPVVEKADAEEGGEGEEERGGDPDVEQNKMVAIAGYVFFLVPVILAPNSKFARFHANQGLLLFIMLVVVVTLVSMLEACVWLVGVVFRSISILEYFFAGSFHLLQAGLLAVWVALLAYGIVQAAHGLRKPLPAIGHWNLIK